MVEYIKKQDAIHAATQDSTEERSHSYKAGQKRAAIRIEIIPAAKVIPIDWIIKQIQEQSLGESKAFSKLLRLWEKENERAEVQS